VANRDGRDFAPTAKRKREARRDGRLPRSAEIAPAAAFFVTVATGGIFVPKLLRTLSTELRRSLSDLGDGTTIATGRLVGTLGRLALTALPMVLVASAVGVVATVAQGGVVLGSRAAKPSLRNLSLRRGLGKLSPRQALPVFVRSMAKLAAIGVAVYAPAQQVWRTARSGRGLFESLGRTGDAVRSFLWTSAVCLAVIAAIDYVWTRRRLSKDLKMTRREITDEARNAEGDPKVKSTRRRKAMEMARRRALPPVSRADVVVTNPTHYAVALAYEAGSPAPKVIAKGVDGAAARIRREAARHGVPIIEDRPLARALHRQCKIGAFVPAALFDDVVNVLVAAYWRRGRFPDFLAGRQEAP
jgi:flagellar biosynthetic protein FlhB